MFGLSFALQMQRADRRAPGTDFRPRFVWRLLILFAIGWLHGLLYSGDILTVYAALGIPLILFYRVRDRWLLIVAELSPRTFCTFQRELSSLRPTSHVGGRPAMSSSS